MSVPTVWLSVMSCTETLPSYGFSGMTIVNPLFTPAAKLSVVCVELSICAVEKDDVGSCCAEYFVTDALTCGQETRPVRKV